MVQKQRSLTANFMMNAFLTMSSFIFPMITFPYVSRVLQSQGTGRVAFATSVLSYFSMLAQLGIPTYGVRACAKVRDDREALSRTVHELFMINLIMSGVAYIMFFCVLFCVPRIRQDKVLFLIISLTILFNTIGMEWLYKALEQYAYITIRSIVFKFFAVVLMFLFVKKIEDYVIYGAITIFAASASNIFNFINTHKFIDMRPTGFYNLKHHIKPVCIFFAMSCATTIYTNLDTVMLGFMKSDMEVGYYNAAVRIKTILVSIVTSLGTVLLPRASYYLENGLREEFDKISGKALNFVLLISIPMIVYFVMFANESIRFLAGGLYEASTVPMQLIMPTLLLIGMTNIMGIQMLVPMGREKYVLYSEVAGACTDLACNAVLIPKFASAGAAVGTVIAECVVWAVQFCCLRNMIKDIYKTVHYGYIATGVFAGLATVFWLKKTGWGAFPVLVCSGLLFFGSYVLIMTLLKEPLILELEHKLLKNILRTAK